MIEPIVIPVGATDHCFDTVRDFTLPPLPHPPMIGQYEILERLGEGKCGEVYRARNVEHFPGREVAIKMASENKVHDAEVQGALRHEALTGAQLEHPSISSIIDLIEQDGITYVVMQLLKGDNLATVLERTGGTLNLLGGSIMIDGGGKPASITVPNLVTSVMSGLSYAHQKGIIHRDIKPENIVAWSDGINGRASIVDFSLARHLTDPLVKRYAGTPNYMAPERRFEWAADARSDVFSLGVMLYRMQTGTLPYQQMKWKKGDDFYFNDKPAPLPPPQNAGEAELFPLIMKCIDKDPLNRCQSVEEMEQRYRKAVDLAMQAIVSHLKEKPVR